MASAAVLPASTAARASVVTTAKQSDKDIWASIIAQKTNNSNAAASSAASNASTSTSTTATQQREASLLFVGPHCSGKSTLIQSYMFKDRVEVPKPTSALDYRYTRTSMKDTVNEEKSLSHFWELGGGHSLIDLMDIVVTEQSIRDLLVIIVVDCSRPSALLNDAQRYINMVRKKTETTIQQLKNKGSTVPGQLATQQKKRLGESHPDVARVSLMPVQTLLVAHKFDAIAQQGPEELRVLTRALRILAHRNGCSVCCTSTAQKEALNKTYRNRISQHLMGIEKKSTPLFNHLELIYVPLGTDSFAQIGEANASSSHKEQSEQAIAGLSADALVSGWLSVFEGYFPGQAADVEPAVNVDELKLLPEAQIDALVNQKEEELKKKKREVDVQRKMQATEIKKK